MGNKIEDNIKNNIKADELNISAKPVVRFIFLIGGFFFVGIGILGMFLPLLPTTIFLLLAAWCFARSSERFHNWLHTNRFFGKYLSDYRIRRGMTIGSKIFSISFLWIGILTSALFLTKIIYVRILLILIALGVTWHLLAIKTIKEN